MDGHCNYTYKAHPVGHLSRSSSQAVNIPVSIAYFRHLSPHRLTMGFLKIAAVTLALCSAVSQASVLPRAPAIVETDFDVLIVGGGPAGLSALSGVSRVRRTALLLDGGEYRNGETRHMHDVIGNDGEFNHTLAVYQV